ncbi:aspartyl/asparaginyl beta-hydroxylase domain-containing protein, partial [Kaarinaea lacus]
RDAMFSLLEPHADIDRHQDYHNVYLTCHLGLIIPENAYIQVAGIEKRWEEGKCLVFDSSYTHSAHNHDDNPRLILLVDFLHPDINEAEFDWLEQVGLA